jgi:hypothetical protein
MNPTHRAYIVKKIRFTFPNEYHVVNTATKVTHTMYVSLEMAKTVAKDLNMAARRERIANSKKVA